jgi:D-glycero-D-manno-heptose 1,7-bisphosphate phosphatase
MTTLFLDRDGVINVRLPDDYVKTVAEFEFCPQVPQTIARLSAHFDFVFIVTNQSGIGKGLMDHDDLALVHQHLLREVSAAGGRIDAVYYSPDRKDQQPNSRKPNPDMAFWAQRDFPAVDFTQAWMVGDSLFDIEFGERLGMKTALIEGKFEEAVELAIKRTDWRGPDLLEFANWLLKP